ncbi:MmgE/PrpD family protein, partial [Georgenia sp. 10Sc9-8]|nr:MmgE/PrpD family protein [Georgenia halotolerans]
MQRDSTTDPWLDSIAAFAAAPAADLDEQVRGDVLVRVVDAIGCALGARGNDAPEVATRYARRRSAGGEHAIWGTGALTDAEGAALAN